MRNDDYFKVEYPVLILTKLDEYLLCYEEKGEYGGIINTFLGWYKSLEDVRSSIENFLINHPECHFVMET